MDNENSQFHTLWGYENLHSGDEISPSMEDYLEMIYRYCMPDEGKNLLKLKNKNHKPIGDNHTVSVTTLAKNLNVRPSSASKMVVHLKNKEYVAFEKYGKISLTKKGMDYGKYLLKRHKILNDFFCLINGSHSELEQVE
ncbi:MAG: metal-dependent transcriptional regulator, partial [Clostridia bacterium]